MLNKEGFEDEREMVSLRVNGQITVALFFLGSKPAPRKYPCSTHFPQIPLLLTRSDLWQVTQFLFFFRWKNKDNNTCSLLPGINHIRKLPKTTTGISVVFYLVSKNVTLENCWWSKQVENLTMEVWENGGKNKKGFFWFFSVPACGKTAVMSS